MANQQATFNLGIKTTADLKGVNELKRALNEIRQLSKDPSSIVGDNDQATINKILKSANDLELAMQRAYNPKINTVNIDKFKQSLVKSNTSVSELKANLLLAGTQGAQAFNNMATSLMQFGTATKQTSAFLDKIATSIGNTVRYQVLNSLWRSMTSSIGEAVGYVKNLDSSLNNIQIVTEKSTDNMKKFAQEANAAAQNLGTKTTDYTDASLIYYQQGLGDEEVKDRTDVTIKMANVLGESASDVSSYMTAIWNNFDDGSKSLEYFGDVITNLGAHTASSAAEIAEGLEKFAAVGDTVGLSYEYATAALATVVAETRQSADTVGTAFKTLFARIQGLKLGETLDDGTDLNKYSKALDAVGISIKDQQGNLKDMDTILEEMGARWQTLAKDQQVALAQTIAGTRQYTQLVALMDNWGKVQENISVASESAGTLEKKQAIYMQSTEAHLNEMTAAWENFYDSMLDTDTLNSLYDFFGGLGNGLAKMADSIGGIIPVLTMLGSTGLKVFSNQISGAITNAIANLQNFKSLAEDSALKQAELSNLLGTDNLIMSGKGAFGNNETFINDSMKEMMSYYEEISKLKNSMSQEEISYSNQLIKNYGDVTNQLLAQKDEIEAINNEMEKSFGFSADKDSKGNFNIDDIKDKMREVGKAASELQDKINTAFQGRSKNNILESQKKAIKEYGEAFISAGGSVEKLRENLNKTIGVDKIFNIDDKGFIKFKSNIEFTEEEIKKLTEMAHNQVNISFKMENADQVNQQLEATRTQIIQLQQESLKEFQFRFNVDSAVKMVGAIGQLSSALLTFKNIGNIWSNSDLDTGERILQTVTNMGFVLPQLISSLKTLFKVESIINGIKAVKLTLNKKENEDALNAYQVSNLINIQKLSKIKLEEMEQALQLEGISKEEAHTLALELNTSATLANKLAKMGLITVCVAAAAAITALIVKLSDNTEAIKNNAKAAELRAEATQKELDADKEKLENIKNLKDEYAKLKEQEDDLSDDELRTKVYNLCVQYGDEQIAIESLSGAYKDLNEAMKKLEERTISETKESQQRAMIGNKNALATGLMKSASEDSSNAGGNRIDLDEGGNTLLPSFARDILDKGLLTQEEIKNLFSNSLSSGGDNISIDLLVKMLMENKDAFLEILTNYVGKNAEWAIQLYGYIEDNQDKIDALTNTITDGQKLIVQEAVLNNKTNLQEVINELIASGMEFEQAKKLVFNEYLNSGNDELVEITQKYSLASVWADKHGDQDLDIIKSKLEGWSEEEILFFEANLDLAAAYDNLEDFKNNISEKYISIGLNLKAANSANNALDVLTQFDSQKGSEKKRTWKNEYTTQLYEDQGFKDFIGINEEQFNLLDDSQKLAKVQEFYDAQVQIAKDAYEDIQQITDTAFTEQIQTLENKKRELQNELYNTGYGDYDERGFSKNNIIKSDLFDAFTFEGTDQRDWTEDSKDFFNKIYEGIIEEIFKNPNISKSELEDLIAKYKEDADSQGLDQIQNDLDDEKIVSYFEKRKEEIISTKKDIDDLGKAIDSLNNTTQQGIKIEKDYDREISIHKNRFRELNEEIDNVQSSYKTLKSAFEEYNESGILSIDTIQSLLDLEPEYLQFLIDENGELNLNEESLNKVKEASKQLAIVKIEEAKVEAYEAAQIELEKLAQDEAAASALAAEAATWRLAASRDGGAAAAEKAAAAEQAYREQLKATSELGGIYAEAAQVVDDRLNARIQLLNAAKDGLDTNFDKAIGTEKSSSSSSSKQNKDEKRYKEEFDLFYKFKKAIEDLEDTLSDVSKLQSHLFGKELANSLRESNKLIAQQKQNYEALLTAQKAELQDSASLLADYGAEFDLVSGQIVNYAEITTKALEEYNNAVKTFNASAQSEADKTAMEAAQKSYDLFKKQIEEYDKLITEVRNTENKIDDLYYKEIENNFKAWEAEIKVDLDLEEAQRTWDKFLNGINKNFKLVFKDISADMKQMADEANSLAKSGGTIDIRMNAMSEVEAEIDKMMAGGKSDKFVSVSEAQETLKKYMEELQDDAQSLYDLYQSAWDGYLEGIDQAIDKFDNLIAKYENIMDDLDYQGKMIELLYGKKAYSYFSELYTAQANNLLGQMSSLNEQIKFYQQQYETDSALYGADSEAAKKWKDKWTSAISDLHKTEENYLSAIQKQAENSIDEIFDKLEKKLTEGTSLSWLSEEWDDLNNKADRYYDDVERIYQLDSLSRKYQDAIDKSSSVTVQEKLKAIMNDQVSALKDKNKLSKYDIELAEKKLEVYQAQIALEEAQNNKNTMKLTRDASGNWSYQYVADEDELKEKEQDLLDKQNQYYEFAKQSWQDLTKEIIEDTQTALERIKELENESLTATEERQAEISAEIERLKEYYWGEEGLITLKTKEYAEYEDNLNKASAELLWSLYETDASNFETMNNREKDLITALKDHGVSNFTTLYNVISQDYESIKAQCETVNQHSIDTWSSAANEIIRKWNSGDSDSVRQNITDALSACTEVFNNYAEMVRLGCQAAGEDFTDVRKQIQLDEEATRSLQHATQELVQSTTAELNNYRNYLAQVEQAWLRVKDRVIDACNTALTYLRKVGSVANDISNRIDAVTAKANNIQQSTSKTNSGGTPNNTATEPEYQYYANSVGSFTIVKADTGQVVEYYGSSTNTKLKDLESRYGKGNIVSKTFATGGYTGEWNGSGDAEAQDGKLAYLHQKELVLNADDTENMLSIVNTVRDLVSSKALGLITSAIGSITTGSTNISNVSTNNNTNNNSQATYNITAEFPNANDVNEIREAILSLPNMASQYSMIK